MLWIDPLRNRIHQFGQAIAKQHDAKPAHTQSNPQPGEGIKPHPAGHARQQGADQHGGRDGCITQQVENRSSAVEIVMVIGSEQTRRQQVHHQTSAGSDGHRPRRDQFRLPEALESLHANHCGGHQNQHGIDDSCQLG